MRSGHLLVLEENGGVQARAELAFRTKHDKMIVRFNARHAMFGVYLL